MKTTILTREKPTAGVARILNRILSDEYVLMNKTRNFQWNISETGFDEFYRFFANQCEEMEQEIDQIALRVRSLGHTTSGCMSSVLKNSSIKEKRGEGLKMTGMVNELLSDHEKMIDSLRNSISAAQEKYCSLETCDFLCKLLEQHEKRAWMLKALTTYI